VNASDSWPLLLVAALIVAAPLLNVPLAPLPGAANATVAAGDGVAEGVADRDQQRAGEAVVTAVLWGVPEVALTLAAAPAVLVRLNDAGVPTPLTEAVTL